MRLLLSALLLSTAVPAAGSAQTPPPVRQYGGLVLSPRGDQIATIEAGAGPRAVVTLRSASDGRIIRTLDPCATCSYAGLAYAPNGALAFLARDRTAGTTALDLATGARVRTVATIPGLAQTPRVSPDGKRIALLVTIGAAKESGATQAGVRQVGEIGESNDEQRLAIFDIAGPATAAAAVRPLSPAGRYVYEYDWTPDGREIVATTALGNGDANWWVATLDAIDTITGEVRPIARPTTQLNFPRVSPDGRTVAYVGGLMSDFGSVGGDIFTVPVSGGTPSNRTPGYKATVTSLDWTAGGIRATTLQGANAAILSFDPVKPVLRNAAGGVEGARAIQWSRPASFSAGDGRVAYSADGRTAAAVVQDYEHAPAIYAGPVASLRQLTHDNDAALADFTARSITWRNGGYDVQGWLLTPRGVDPAAKLPMIVNVHGGPSSAHTPAFQRGGVSSDFAKAGYAIFLPNPRGSYGQGEAFTAANKRDFGGGDLKDILAGVDAVEKVAPIDDARLGLMGGSYGGFMAMWANTQTNRFKAIHAAAGLSNWISYYGTNGIDQWMIPFFGRSVYDDPKAYADVSAINFIKNARTPTLITVGERDIEVPPTQSLEYYKALKAMNVPTTLVIYPDEGHSIRDPKNAADQRRRLLGWFDRYLKRAPSE